jgi:integrase
MLRLTKNGKPRVVSVAPALLHMMRLGAPKLANGDAYDDARLFGYAGRWSVNQAIERACARQNIKYLSSHKCGRHAFASLLLDDGKTLQVVMVSGGWSGIAVVSKKYGHLEHGMASKIQTGIGNRLLASTPPTHEPDTTNEVNAVEQEKTPAEPGFGVVGATGIEPVTPTMSR